MSGSIATPRTAAPHGTYTGEDLRRTSPRPGAYDAYAIPSRMGDRLVTREQQKDELLAPLPPAPPVPISRGTSRVAEPEPAPLGEPPASPPPAPEPVQAPPVVSYVRRASEPVQAPNVRAYTPRGGSFPDLVLTHLREHGGHLLYSEIAERYGVQPTSMTTIFKPALFRGALIRLRIGKHSALALPGYAPPGQPPAPASTTAPVRRVVSTARPAPSMAELGRVLEGAAHLLMQAAALLQLGGATDHVLTNLAGETHAHD